MRDPQLSPSRRTLNNYTIFYAKPSRKTLNKFGKPSRTLIIPLIFQRIAVLIFTIWFYIPIMYHCLDFLYPIPCLLDILIIPFLDKYSFLQNKEY